MAGFMVDFTVADLGLVIVFFVLVLLGGIFDSGIDPIANSILGDVNPPHVRTTIYSINYIAKMIGRSVGILIVGLLQSIFGGIYKWGYITVTAILICSIIFLIILRKTVPSDLESFKSKYKKE